MPIAACPCNLSPEHAANLRRTHLDVPRKILLVEDHADTAKVLARLLRLQDYDVTVASGYRSAAEDARAQRFDLLLGETTLPDGDGCELLQEIRALYPIEGIAVSGYGMQQDVERCVKAGYRIHLLKPTSFERIYEAICATFPATLGHPEFCS